MSVKVVEKISLKEVTSSVQGSTLDPVLLLIYVKCIANTCDCCWKALLMILNCI